MLGGERRQALDVPQITLDGMAAVPRLEGELVAELLELEALHCPARRRRITSTTTIKTRASAAIPRTRFTRPSVAIA